MSDLSGRVAVVTGAGTGIGRAIALRLSEAGARVGLVGRTSSSLEAVAAEAKGRTRVALADVADRAAVGGAFDDIVSELGAPDAVVANAGVGGPNPHRGEDRWDEIVRTNLDGAYHTLRAFEGRLDADATSWRHAIVISSCVARFGVPGISAYSAAKAGQLGLVRSLAVELAPKRVLVNAICPGWVETRMAEERMGEIGEETDRSYPEAREELIRELPLQRISEPAEIAELAAFLLSPAGASFTGQAFDPNNGAWMG